MNPPCAKCKKTVYPTEKFSCLDKVWHKLCFKCETCGMKLTMKNYKGYNKLPYCNAHYPTTKFTAVSDTPENMRLKKNTTNQSSVVYQKEFIKEKGKFTAVADDPETMRAKKTQQNASDLKYHEKFEKEKVSQQSYGGYRPQEQAAQPQIPRPITPPADPEPEPPAPAPSAPAPAPSNDGNKYVALYDYTAADDDEVSFNEGDIIVNGDPIDEGWMTGTVQRTGETGMLPSNYVEAC